MSLSRRLFDLARANLGVLLDAPEDDVLARFSDEDLQAELERRRLLRLRQERSRASAASAERAARERARGRPRPDGEGSAAEVPGAGRLDRLYAELETDVGADAETVKRNYRRLLRLHHPDFHGGSEDGLRAATERTARLTAAYDELMALL